MDDQFLYDFRDTPSPEFSTRLRARLRDHEHKQFMKPWTRLALAASVAFVLAAGAFAAPSVRAVGAQVAALFNGRDLAPGIDSAPATAGCLAVSNPKERTTGQSSRC